MNAVHISELFELPERVKKADFVHNLANGVAAPEETVRQYVITPAIERALGNVLGLAAAAMRENTSLGMYIHGSFGSGKSHFMAMFSLMLDGVEAVWRRPELHALKDAHRALDGKRLLQLRFHMIGQANLESAVFTSYTRFVQEQHPEAPLPALFDDAPLFDSARAVLEQMGEKSFFDALGGGEAADADWGDLGGGWNRARFEQVCQSGDPKERAELYSALVKSRFFSAFAQQSSGFVDIDRGLSVLARHAQGLGYAGVVLFLDELVLWLSQGAGRSEWLHNEAQKVVKLVEFQHARPIPIVSLVARQRDLAEMVGEQFAGNEAAALQQSLKWKHERFNTVNLEDTDLPTIVAKRLLAPKPGAAAQMDAAFARLQTSVKAKSWNTLLGQENADAFRKLYPFSPVLVEALVGLSNALQRNRTAIRLLTEMLVEHVPDLKLGEVVPVGDLFDLIAGGDNSADGVMRPRLEAARQLYQHKLLPMLQAQHGTASPEKCQRLRPGHAQKLGCAGCPEKLCRNNNRFLKTLLLAALVPEVPSFKGLTVSRLVELNHGAIQSSIPGNVGAQVVSRLQGWAQEIGALHLGAQTDPTVSLHLDGVDLDPILEQYQSLNTPGARQRRIRDLLFSHTGLPAQGDGAAVDSSVDWYETTRQGQVLFGNVRKLASAGSAQLRCPEDHAWRLVIDYPFDELNFGPQDDLATLDEIVSRQGPTWTVCWLPSFFSQKANHQLGQLVILDHILSNATTTQQAVQHLSPAEQQRAHTDLRSLQAQKVTYLTKVLEQAYGLRKLEEDDIDPDRRLENNLYLMASEEPLSPKLAGNLESAVQSYVVALLEKRYPHHPHFGRKLTKNTVAEALGLLGRVIDSGEKRLALPKDKITLLMDTLGQLGVVRSSESAVLLAEDLTLRQLEQERLKANENKPSVAQVRRWLDPNELMGLTVQAQDLLVRAYARWDGRTLSLDGKPHTPAEGRPLPPGVELDKPELPTPTQWEKALDLAGAAFGLSLGSRALNADSLQRFGTSIDANLSKVAVAVVELPERLRQRQTTLGLPEETDRYRTARCAQRLCSALVGKTGLEQVRLLAEFEVVTSPRALGKSLSQAVDCLHTLGSDLTFGHFAGLDRLVGGAALIERLRGVLRQDEIIEPLRETVEALAKEAMDLARPPSGPEPVFASLYSGNRRVTGRAAASQALDEFYREAKERLATAGSRAQFTLNLDVAAKPDVARTGRANDNANADDVTRDSSAPPAARAVGARTREDA